MFYSLKTYYAVPTTRCNDAVTKRNLMFGIISLAHTHNRRQLATPNKPLYSLSKSYGHKVGASTYRVNTGNYPANKQSV